ncbi:MAG: hypothetical protein WCF96_07215 [Eubacteriales bacterium]
MRTLVVYYSRTGKVKMAAISLAKELNSDILEIVDKDKRKGILGFIKSGRSATKKEQANIEKITVDLKEYELIVLCSQVWAGNISAPARAFLNIYGKDINNIAYMLMHGAKNEYMEVLNAMDSIVCKTRKWNLSLPVRSDIVKEIHEFVSKSAL